MADLPATLLRLREHFDSGATRGAAWRMRQLEGLRRFLLERQEELLRALRDDLGKPAFEAYGAEIGHVLGEVENARSNLGDWMADRHKRVPVWLRPMNAQVVHEPLGVVLIIAPWNYPVELSLSPLVGALAAGNCAFVKLSEYCPHVNAELANLAKYLDPEAVVFAEMDAAASAHLVQQNFDHIFFTGSSRVGRLVYLAAAANLTPVTLELGGKCPAFVDGTHDLKLAAERIAWGKFLNAGQTCIAPDYVVVTESAHDGLVAELKKVLLQFYGSDPRKSPDFARIVTVEHTLRLQRLLDQSGGEVVCGGDVALDERYVAPTVVTGIGATDALMSEEIFGPILPILRVASLDEGIAILRQHPDPLAVYAFTRDHATERLLREKTRSGAFCVSHVWLHYLISELPFGGVGMSGIDSYHGRRTFERFSHKRALVRKPTHLAADLFFPPYSDFKFSVLKKLVGK